ncbi:kinase-like domain-containing protein [Rhizophagus irregularis DAOM 181602=DAOM 197198]|nr:kinase-like domain-containing protein [Rhizophagus irregularis DAOM 181602=DAOM 197198]
MAELSSGKPPFYNKKHNLSLALSICNGSRPEFGNGTPGFYKKLAYKCMDANPGERPTAYELDDILKFWYYSIRGEKDDKEEFGHKGKEINEAFEEADKEIPTISTSYEKNSNAVYTSAFTFTCDSQLIDLEVSNSI